MGRGDAVRILRFAFLGLVAGFILAVLADRSVWLEMRLDTGLLLPAATGIAAVAGSFSGRQVPAAAFLGLELLLVLVLLAGYGFSPGPLRTMPASIFREGFFLGDLALRQVNDILIVLLALVNGLFLVPVTGPGAGRPGRRDIR